MLVTALSQLYVAFTIEFDHAVEQRMPHRTTRGPAAGSQRGPWLISRAMWANCLRWIPTAVAEPLLRLVNVGGLQRWGYLTADDPPALRRGGVAIGRIAEGLTAEIEERWARVLIRYAAAHEAASKVPLHLGANVLRVVPAEGIRTRDLPLATGIAREAAAMSVTSLAERGLVAAGDRIALTERGARAQAGLPRIAAAAETGFPGVEEAATAILDQRGGMVETLRPHPEGWRARSPYLAQTRALLADPRAVLPHFPMVLHRGEYPDGS